MFIWSVKLNRNLLWGFCAAICLSIGAVALFTPKGASDVLKNNIDTRGESFEQQVAFLSAFGYEADEQPVLIEEIIIPSEFDENYKKYNDFQKLSGFDLSRFKGQRAKKYTYRIKNYPNKTEEVLANVIVYGGKIIGGDIATSSPDGFIHGFVKE